MGPAHRSERQAPLFDDVRPRASQQIVELREAGLTSSITSLASCR